MPKFMMMPPQSSRTREWAARLAEALPEYEMLLPETDADARVALPEVDAAYGWIPPEMLSLAQKLRWLQSPAIAPRAGYYYPLLAEHPVTICNPRDTYSDHIGQHILMFVLALARGLPYYLDAQRQSRWDTNAHQSRYIDLTQATALILGVGGIGRETARLCLACEMQVIGVDARWEMEVPGIEAYPPEALDRLLPRADFVIVTVPHTPETEGMWYMERLCRMKPASYFINVGRGKTTRLDDLVEAIETGVIAGCALDVFETEPLPPEHKLWKLPNVLLTPHVAAKGAGNVPERQFQLLLDNARRFAAGERLRNIVDKTLWY